MFNVKRLRSNSPVIEEDSVNVKVCETRSMLVLERSEVTVDISVDVTGQEVS